MITTTGTINAINRELSRLGIDNESNPHSGISTSVVQEDVFQVKIYDDYDSGIYNAEGVLSILENYPELTHEDFWQTIAKFEV